MKNYLICLLLFLSNVAHAQKYKGWYLGLNAGLGHAYLHNKNFDYYIKAKGELGEAEDFNGVTFLQADKLINEFNLTAEFQRELSLGYIFSGNLSFQSQTTSFNFSADNAHSMFMGWYPSQKEMKLYEAKTTLQYLQGKIFFGKSFNLHQGFKLETKGGVILGYLVDLNQLYFSQRDSLTTYKATSNKEKYYSIAKTINNQVAINTTTYSKTNKPYNYFIPGLAFECNLVGKVGAGKANFEKWRYKIGIYAQTDLRDVEGKAWNWFMPPQLKYPNAPSYTIRSGIQFGLSYHFNKR